MVIVLPFISTLCIVISAVLIAMGWSFIIRGKEAAHKRTMTMAAGFAILFFIIYITRTIAAGNTSFGGPENIKPYYIAFLLFHIALALTGVTFGVITITFALRNQYTKHKKLGRWAAMIWFFSAITGVSVYLFLYVIWEPGAITSMMEAILG
jgi:putative membrane protein